MPLYDMALVTTIEADNFDDAVKQMKLMAQNQGNIICYSADFMDMYEHDNSGQRVLYLHPETADNTWECE